MNDVTKAGLVRASSASLMRGSKTAASTITGSLDSLGPYRASSSWSFDEFDQDQVLTLPLSGSA